MHVDLVKIVTEHKQVSSKRLADLTGLSQQQVIRLAKETAGLKVIPKGRIGSAVIVLNDK